mgnify:CR=1 FL=1
MLSAGFFVPEWNADFDAEIALSFFLGLAVTDEAAFVVDSTVPRHAFRDAEAAVFRHRGDSHPLLSGRGIFEVVRQNVVLLHPREPR